MKKKKEGLGLAWPGLAWPSLAWPKRTPTIYIDSSHKDYVPGRFFFRKQMEVFVNLVDLVWVCQFFLQYLHLKFMQENT